MGDLLIVVATGQFFDRNELPYHSIKDKQSCSMIVYGGGGTRRQDYEEKCQNLLPLFNRVQKIIILPSSFYHCEKLIDIPDERFVVFCRKKQSYDYLKNAHTKAEILLDHDMVFRPDASLFEEE